MDEPLDGTLGKNGRPRFGSVCVCEPCKRNATHSPAALAAYVCAKLASAMQPIFVAAMRRIARGHLALLCPVLLGRNHLLHELLSEEGIVWKGESME